MDDLRVRLSTGCLHDLTDQVADGLAISAQNLLHSVRVGCEDFVDGVFDGRHIGDLEQIPGLGDGLRIAVTGKHRAEHLLGGRRREVSSRGHCRKLDEIAGPEPGVADGLSLTTQVGNHLPGEPDTDLARVSVSGNGIFEEGAEIRGVDEESRDLGVGAEVVVAGSLLRRQLGPTGSHPPAPCLIDIER